MRTVRGKYLLYKKYYCTKRYSPNSHTCYCDSSRNICYIISGQLASHISCQWVSYRQVRVYLKDCFRFDSTVISYRQLSQKSNYVYKCFCKQSWMTRNLSFGIFISITLCTIITIYYQKHSKNKQLTIEELDYLPNYTKGF